ncbi:UbiA family prenyltransferase [Kribbella sandramycini]|uniref:UbiA family prenyltransferase n=1 Tax=Kribbella sandramycini TaxID=60450 RepID=A0A7Y4NXJ2_9ACTN|nr:UbiA family prenyltransferase [Kribbella sandramycini]NOL39947.1 UbiA family prenyltransferase [Kribbella sandramycini]
MRALVELVRAPAALTVPGDVLAGAVAAGDLRVGRAVGLSASSICIYWAGMALNDWADRELDAVERPERPIPSGRVPAGTAFNLAAGLTAGGLALSALSGGKSTLATSTALAATAWTYDVYAKNTIAGPAVMASARALDVLVGAGPTRRRALAPALAVGAHILGVTTLSRGEVHGSTPTPARASLAATTALTLTTARPSRIASAHVGRQVITAALAGWFARAVGPAQTAAARAPEAANVRRAVGAGIHGLVPLQAAWIARGGAPRLGAGLVLALPLVKALAKKVSST